jgi:ABC-type transport system substrate-binding protein
MAQQWAEAGITVTINPMEVGAILEDWNSGNFKMAMVSASWLPDPSNEVDRFHSESPRGKSMKINDPELDTLIEQGLEETDPDARVEIYKQIEQYALEQAYIIVPYVYGWRWELVWDYVKGYDVMPSNSRISTRKTWLDV